ncbi:TolC family protein [bacterium]|nr:TolC family protein [bacterium]
MYKKCLIIIFIVLITINVYALDLTLEQSIDLTLQNNSSIKLFRERVKEADYLVAQARSAFFPSITGQASFTKLDQVPYISFPPEMYEGLPPEMTDLFPDKIEMGKDENWLAKLTVQQPLFAGFKILNSYRISKLNKEVENLDYISTKNEIVYYTKMGYFNLLKANYFYEIAEQSQKQMKAHLEDLEYMFEEGLLAKNDLLKARVRLSRVDQLVQQAIHAKKLAHASLCILMGIDDTEDLNLTDSLTIEDYSNSQEDAVNTAIDNRPELMQLDLAEKIAQKNITMKSMAFFPNLVLIYNYNYQKPNRELQNEWYDSWDATLAMQWNIWDWTRSIYALKQAKSQKRQVLYSRESLNDQVSLQVKQAYLALEEASISVEITQDEVEQAQENFRVTQEKFDEGMATNTELLDAHSDLTRAKFDHLNTLADYNISLAELLYYLGITHE